MCVLDPVPDRDDASPGPRREWSSLCSGGHNRSDYCSLRGFKKEGRRKNAPGSLQPGATCCVLRCVLERACGSSPVRRPDSAPKQLVGRLEEVRCRAGIPSVFLCCAAGRLPAARSLPWERRALWGEAVVRGRMDGWLGKKLKAGCLSSRLSRQRCVHTSMCWLSVMTTAGVLSFSHSLRGERWFVLPCLPDHCLGTPPPPCAPITDHTCVRRTAGSA